MTRLNDTPRSDLRAEPSGRRIGGIGAVARSGGLAGCAMRLFLVVALAFSAAGAVRALSHPAVAYANPPVYTVSDEDFAPAGYEWSFDFESVSSEVGFVYVEDISKHYSRLNVSDPDAGVYDCVKEGDSGYAAYIDYEEGRRTDENGEPLFTLRFKNGTYNGTKIDAEMSIVDWRQIDPPLGWRYYWMQSDPGKIIPDLETGVYFNLGYTNDARNQGLHDQPSLSNMNFYLVGISELAIEVDFFYAGTDVEIPVKGHLTSIDLDGEQEMLFDECVERVEIAERSLEPVGDFDYALTYDRDGKVSASEFTIAASNSDGYYERGLVGAFFSYKNSLEPLSFKFYTPWNGTNTHIYGPEGTAISFFALTGEYVANPPVDEVATVSKSVDETSPVEVGDTVSFRVDLTVPVEGSSCRYGYRYTSLSIVDEVDAHLKVDPTSVAMLVDDAKLGGTAGSFAGDGSNGTVEYRFDSAYLEETSMLGQTYALEFDATVVSRPQAGSDGRYLIPNVATATVNNVAEIETNVVYVEVTAPPTRDVAVTKRIAADEVHRAHGDPAFLFELSGTDASGAARTYRELATFPEGAPVEDGYLVARITFEDVPAGTYTLEERDAVRYALESIDSNGTVEGQAVTFDLTRIEQPAATFTNGKTTNDGGSDAASVVNRFVAA